jgi:hypothetical protein
MILGWKLTEPMRIKPCLFIPHLTHTKSTQIISSNYGGHDFSLLYTMDPMIVEHTIQLC